MLFAQRLLAGPVPLRQSGSVLDPVIAHAEAFILREATDSPKRSFHLRRIRRLWLHMAYAQRNRCKWEVVLTYRSLLKFSAWTVREEFSFCGRLDASLRHAQAASSSLASVARARF